jgi:hypothetical protein
LRCAVGPPTVPCTVITLALLAKTYVILMS